MVTSHSICTWFLKVSALASSVSIDFYVWLGVVITFPAQTFYLINFDCCDLILIFISIFGCPAGCRFWLWWRFFDQLCLYDWWNFQSEFYFLFELFLTFSVELNFDIQILQEFDSTCLQHFVTNLLTVWITPATTSRIEQFNFKLNV